MILGPKLFVVYSREKVKLKILFSAFASEGLSNSEILKSFRKFLFYKQTGQFQKFNSLTFGDIFWGTHTSQLAWNSHWIQIGWTPKLTKFSCWISDEDVTSSVSFPVTLHRNIQLFEISSSLPPKKILLQSFLKPPSIS